MSVARASVCLALLRRVGSRGVLLAIAFLGLVGRGGAIDTNRGGPTPGDVYQAAFGPFYEGEYDHALKIYQNQWSGAIKSAQSRWIDSICYHTMIGECFYQMGQLDKALEQYTAAVRLYVTFSEWMQWVQFPETVAPDLNVAAHPIPWGRSTRQTPPGNFPKSMLIRQGVIDQEPVVRQGGVVQQAMLLSINAVEIVRCTALAIRRRNELLGPLAVYDPVNNELVVALSRRPARPNHWSQCWIDLQLGLAQVGAGKTDEAIGLLRRSLAAAGQFDHPMTGMALYELGRIALERGEYTEAIKHFEEASYSAAYFGDYGVVEESLRWAATTHLLTNQGGGYAPLVPAAQWGRAKNWRQFCVSMLLCGAEEFLRQHRDRDAGGLLDEARGFIGRRAMGSGELGGRLHYLQAQAYFQQHKLAPGTEALAAARSYLEHGSRWLFHLHLLEQEYASGQMTARGSITPRAAMELYSQLLRDPGAGDWSLTPMEALAVMLTPHPAAFEHWFLIAMERKEVEAAVEIADRARRHRFFSSLPLGGRVEGLRWILEAPEAALTATALQQRQNFLAEQADYAPLSQQAQQLRRELEGMPLVPSDTEAQRKQSEVLVKLEQVSQQQEGILHGRALDRQPVEMVFPPLRTTKEIQAGLPAGTALLDFFAVGNEYYGFVLNNSRYGHWRVRGAATLSKRIMGLLRDFGQHDANRPLSSKDLQEVSWKESGKKLLDGLLEGSMADFSQSVSELVIVPDGLLWYLPFEALGVKQGETVAPLISHTRIRYAPTAALAVADGRPAPGTARTLVVLGRLSGKQNEGNLQKAFEEFNRAVPDSVSLSAATLPTPSSVFASTVDRLVVLDDLTGTEAGPYSWSPLSPDRGKPGSTLADWFALPWKSPAVVVLPGFHTAAESGLKRLDRDDPGGNLFLSVCGLMANGAQTVLLSRWRTGGQSSFDLVREFVQELPGTLPAEAWQRAVLLTSASRLEVEAEPRIQPQAQAAQKEPLTGAHPFFWAGYLLVDSGPYVKPEGAMAAPAQLPQPQAPAAGLPDPAAGPPGAELGEPAAEPSDEGEDNTKNAKARPSHSKRPAKTPSKSKASKAER